MATDLTDLVLRPGYGSVGKKVNIRANFFEMTAFGTSNVIHYDVTVDPPQTPVPVIRKVWAAFEDAKGQGIFNTTKVVFDGRKNMFSPKPLDLGEEHAKSFTVNLQEGRIPKAFTLRLKKASEVNMEELRLFLERKSRCTSNCLTAIMVLDILIRNVPIRTFTTIGPSFYTPENKQMLPNAAEVWQGFYQSARPTQGKMMINLDVSASAFHEACGVPEFVAKFLGRRSIDDLRRGIPDRDIQKLGKHLKGISIKSTHRGERNVKRTIRGITPKSASETMFSLSEGGNETSIAEYFARTYNKRLEFPFLPCLVVGKENFLPMEVCEVVPGQRLNKKLNEKQTADMIKFTCQKPHVRANKIKQGFGLLQFKENVYTQQFGVSVKPEMAVIKARVLPTPKITYHTSSQDHEFSPQGGAWNLRGKKVAQGATLGSWSVVNFAGGIPLPVIQRFVRELCQTFIDTGLNVVNRTPPISSADPNGNVERSLKEAWLRAGNSAKANPQLIVCILPNTGTPLYALIKRVSDTVIGVPTQCLQSKHVQDAKKQYCANVCLKVNLKLGGMNLYLAPPFIPFIAQRPTIVIGADVTHPGPGDMSRPSIAALAASMDARASRYTSCIRVQSNREEIMADLANMMTEVLRSFYQSCGQKPERILFYRDGVSEGQFKKVMDQEVAAIHAACASLQADYKPTVTFVVVQKRHHARFFPMETRDADRTGNCMPGTVVDSDIVHPFEFDFYLQSHAGLQGTSRPTHYHVLYDDNRFTADALQEISYNLCHIYGRATRVVSLVPPAYYADLVAARARFHSRDESFGSEGISESRDEESQMASFAVVKPELQKVMYFM